MNVCLDHLRRRAVRKEESALVETADGVVDRVTQVAEQSPAGDPERQMWNRELGHRIGGGTGRVDAAGADGFRVETL